MLTNLIFFFFKGGGTPAPDTEESHGHSDGPNGRTGRAADWSDSPLYYKSKKKRFSVFEHIEKSLATIGKRIDRSKAVVEAREGSVAAQHFGIESLNALPLEYRSMRTVLPVSRVREKLPDDVLGKVLEDEMQAIALILQMVL